MIRIDLDEATVSVGPRSYTVGVDVPDVVARVGIIGSVDGGATDHAQLSGRDSSDQHPITAITGLQAALAAMAHLRVHEGPATDSPSPADYDVWIVTP